MKGFEEQVSFEETEGIKLDNEQ